MKLTQKVQDPGENEFINPALCTLVWNFARNHTSSSAALPDAYDGSLVDLDSPPLSSDGNGSTATVSLKRI